MVDKKPGWFHGSQEEWEIYDLSTRKSFKQRPFRYYSYFPESKELQRVLHFIKCIKNGDLPDDETLLWVADTFDSYVDAKSTRPQQSKEGLEEFFGIKAVSGYYTNIERHPILNKMAEIFVEIGEENKNNQEEVALMALKKIYGDDYDQRIDPSSWVRYYRAWHGKENAKKLFKIRNKKQAD